MSAFNYYLSSNDIYIADVHDGSGAYLYLANSASTSLQAVNHNTLHSVAQDLQRQIQCDGSHENSFWVTSSEDLSGTVTYTNSDNDTVSRTFYTSIQGAIDAASSDISSSDTKSYIYIKSGIYNVSETITIPQKLTATDYTTYDFNVCIKGEGIEGEVTIDFGGVGGATTWVDGFVSVDDAGATIIDHENTNELIFENLSISNAKFGLYLSGATVKINNCTFENCGWTGDTPDSSTIDDSLTGATLSDNAEGWGTLYDYDTSTSNSNTSSGYLVEGGAIFIDGCNFEDDLGTATTINGDTIYIKNCIFDKNCGGIYITRGTNATIKNNNIKSTVKTGIYLNQCYKSVVQQNIIRQTYACGIYLDTCFRCHVLDNTIYNTWNAGICLSQSPHSMVQNNTMTDINRRPFNGVGNYTGNTDTSVYTNAGAIDYDIHAEASIVVTGEQDLYVRYWIILFNNTIGPGRSVLSNGSTSNTNWTSTDFCIDGICADVTPPSGINNSSSVIFTNNTLSRGGQGGVSNEITDPVTGLLIDSTVDLACIITNFTGVQPFNITDSSSATVWEDYSYEIEPIYAQLIQVLPTTCSVVYNACTSYGYNVPCPILLHYINGSSTLLVEMSS